MFYDPYRHHRPHFIFPDMTTSALLADHMEGVSMCDKLMGIAYTFSHQECDLFTASAARRCSPSSRAHIRGEPQPRHAARRRQDYIVLRSYELTRT